MNSANARSILEDMSELRWMVIQSGRKPKRFLLGPDRYQQWKDATFEDSPQELYGLPVVPVEHRGELAVES